ncbi:MAG: hypothetical protein ACI86M_003483, partial [Saprospiraceae bacterium]
VFCESRSIVARFLRKPINCCSFSAKADQLLLVFCESRSIVARFLRKPIN